MMYPHFPQIITFLAVASTLLLSSNAEPLNSSLNYRRVAEQTTEIRWYVTPGKKTDVVQTDEDFRYQYEVYACSIPTTHQDTTQR